MKKVIGLIVILMTVPAFAFRPLMVPDEYPTIQDAVDNLGFSDDIIMLAPGTYTGEKNKNIKINCLYDCLITGMAPCQEVVIDAEEQGRIFTIISDNDFAPNISIKNITFRNASIADFQRGGGIRCDNVNLSVDSCMFENNKQVSMTIQHGGAIGCGSDVFLICSNSIFKDNSATYSGGAIFSENAVITDCCFHNNQAGSGGAVCNFYYLKLCNSKFVGNTAQEGGAIVASDYCYIDNCLFESNSATKTAGGALSISEYYQFCVRNSKFILNTAPRYGAIQGGAGFHSEMINCLFYGNQATQYEGGVFFINAGFFEMNNCAIISNQTNTAGGTCVFYSDDNTILSNCIIWNNNTVDGIDIACLISEATQSPTNICIDHSVIEPDSWYCDPDSTFTLEEGVIFSDPLLADIGSGDYRLTAGSPCIDNGNPATFLETDIDGNARPVGAGFDIGVSEYQTVYGPGAHLFMADTALAPGDPFQLDVLSVCGPEASAADLVVMLEVHGNYFFHPSWEPDFQPEQLNLDYGRQKETILDFTWPSGVDPDWGWTFWAALLKPGETIIIGEVDRVIFDIQP